MMWNWIYGLSISLFFLIREATSESKLIQVIPLFFPLLLGFIYNQPPNKQKKNFYGLVSLLVIANVYNIMNNNTFFAAITVGIVGLTVIHLAMEEAPLILNSSTTVKVLGIFSSFILLITYATFYGVEIHYFDPFIPIVPLFLHLVIECIIIYMLYKGDAEIQEKFTNSIMTSRIITTTCTALVFIMGIIHYFKVINDMVLYVIIFVLYCIGFGVASCEKCVCQFQYKKVKNEFDENEDI